MKKAWRVATAALGGLMLMGGTPAWPLSPETAMLLDLLKAKGVITQNEAAEFTKTLEQKTAAAPAEDEHHHTVQSLTDRLERLEQKSGEGMGEALGKVDIGGRIEVDMTTNRAKDAAGKKSNGSDVFLDSAQLNAEAKVNQYVSGRLALLYEEDPNDSDNNNLTLDEAVVSLKGGEACPAYANLGRMYVPFGHFESHFITDPLTLTLGETNDTAVIVGYANDILDLNAGALRGKVKETGKSDHINTAVASATLSLPKKDKDSKEGLGMSGGVSYLSNLATSEELAEATTSDHEVADTVGGVSAFLSMSYDERFFLDAEYLGALTDFAKDDFEFTDANNRRPQAWNVEAAARMMDKLEWALRYGGSDEGGEHFLAENEYGTALLYDIFDKTSLTVEYLFQEFRDNSNNSQATLQVAVEF